MFNFFFLLGKKKNNRITLLFWVSNASFCFYFSLELFLFIIACCFDSAEILILYETLFMLNLNFFSLKIKKQETFFVQYMVLTFDEITPKTVHPDAPKLKFTQKVNEEYQEFAQTKKSLLNSFNLCFFLLKIITLLR